MKATVVNNTIQWYLINLEDKTLGRTCTSVARILQGKNLPNYSPNRLSDQGVILVNASKIKLTGSKSSTKRYYKHSGYPGGLKTKKFSTLIKDDPCIIIKKAVLGMLPKNKLRKKIKSRLKIYAMEDHPHTNINAKKIL